MMYAFYMYVWIVETHKRENTCRGGGASKRQRVRAGELTSLKRRKEKREPYHPRDITVDNVAGGVAHEREREGEER